jgi:hypothetical protein
MTPELEALATARHRAFVEWDVAHAAGTGQKFLEANRAYILARDNQQRQITANRSSAQPPAARQVQ